MITPINYYNPNTQYCRQVYKTGEYNNTTYTNVIPTDIIIAHDYIEKLQSGKINIYEEYKENPEFVKLQNSEYFRNDTQGTEKLINLIKDLETAKNRSIISKYYINFFDGGIEKEKANSNITKCLYNINKVLTDPRISQQVKAYTLIHANNLRFQILALDNLDRILAGNDIKKIEETILNPLVFISL